jgi:hypothetical protein
MLALDPEWMRAAKSDASVIRGVAGLAGPYDFLPFEKGGMADRAMGKVRPPERTQPIHYARGDAPPLWLASGDEDETVRPRNSRNLAAAIERRQARSLPPQRELTGDLRATFGDDDYAREEPAQ